MEERRHPTRIRELRQARQWNQSQLAQLTGYTFTTVHRHETGTRSLDASAIDRYAKVFKITPAELFIDLDEWEQEQAAKQAEADAPILEAMESRTLPIDFMREALEPR